jgi:5-methylcytosine-specific restriction protein B
MTDLHPTISAQLAELQHSFAADGTLPSPSELKRYYDSFRRAFGPEVLRSLGGVELLERMHAHGNRDSLVYWLEFKDDDEFPARFGSILGGSALKFGVYRRKETGTWAKKGPTAAPLDISTDEAVAIAERHRDQLLAAVDVLGALPGGSGADDDQRYLDLQTNLARVAPAVQDSAWGHKYLALLYPDVLDDFHAAEYQRWNLVRLLQLPPRQNDAWVEGRYVCAGRFVALARTLGLALHNVSTVREGPAEILAYDARPGFRRDWMACAGRPIRTA